MNNIDANKKMRITFQAVTIVLMAFILINLQIPSSFTGKSIGLLVLNIISCVGLIAIAIRMNCNNVKRWEMILYYLLNIVFVFSIFISSIELSDIAEDVAISKISYAKGTEEYHNACEDIELDALSSMFAFVIFGVLGIITSIIFAIIGIIKTFVQKAESLNKQTVLNNSSAMQSVDNEISSNLSSKNVKSNYCSNCGKQIDKDAKFCKHCGKEIK